MSRGRKRRKAAALAPTRAEGGVLASPVTLPSYDRCHPLDWVPDFDNAHLQQAAAGRLTIGDPMFHPPAPIDFAPPGRRRC